MNPKVVTFDCADTLIDLKWHPVDSVGLLAQMLDLSFPDHAFRAYGEMFMEWRPQYEAANLTRDVSRLRDFWHSLYEEWLRRHGQKPELAGRFMDLGDQLAYDGSGTWFPLFPETRPCLQRLRDAGYRLAVVSNWDLSLYRILSSLSIESFFEIIIVSLEHGIEKPDPALFRIAMDRLNASPEDVIHIGDREDDDVQGAHAAGIRALRIDRKATQSGNGIIRSLDELPEAFAWSV